MIKKLQLLSLLLFILVFTQCKEKVDTTESMHDSIEDTENLVEETTNNATIGNEEVNSSESNNDTMLFPWLNDLNVRQSANVTAPIITTVKENASLTPTGNVSAKKETLVLRGGAYYDYWIEVKTPNGEIGWVFGGAVKKAAEEKGNAAFIEGIVDFEHFGKYILKDWKFQGKQASSAAHNDEIVSTYKHPSQEQTLVITMSDHGDYGYTEKYELIGMNNSPLKTRVFKFQGDGWLLSEKVMIQNTNPNYEYTRSQKLEKHVIQLNAKPKLVIGAWTKNQIVN